MNACAAETQDRHADGRPAAGKAAPCPPGATDEERLKMGLELASRLAASRVERPSQLAGGHLVALGLSAPNVLDQELPRNLALLEDLGDDVFARVIEERSVERDRTLHPSSEVRAPSTARRCLRLPYRGGEWPILNTTTSLSANVDLFVRWMPKRDLDMRISEQTRLRWERVRENMVAKAEDFPRSLILRDTHARISSSCRSAMVCSVSACSTSRTRCSAGASGTCR